MSARIDILVVGMDKITDKSSYIYDALASKGIKCLIYSRDKTGFVEILKERIKTEIILTPDNIIIDILFFVYLIVWRRPRHVEMYVTRVISQFFYSLICFLLKIPLSVVCIGELYDWENHNIIRKMVDRFTYWVADLLILTELYMEDKIRKYKIAAPEKLFFFHNRIPIKDKCSPERKEKIVLFLNTFKPWRRLELLLDAIPLIVEKVPEAKFLLVGSTISFNNYLKKYKDYEAKLRKKVKDLKIDKYVRILPFDPDPIKYYEQASVFVLPADLVFCNFSLLEAMERCVPAVVSDTEGSSLIIENGVDGLIVKQDVKSFAEAIVFLLSNEEIRKSMGIKAREKIINKFCINKGVEILLQAYLDKLGVNYIKLR
jgi:glycosyltransferase involved in cell wall biosynthesis